MLDGLPYTILFFVKGDKSSRVSELRAWQAALLARIAVGYAGDAAAITDRDAIAELLTKNLTWKVTTVSLCTTPIISSLCVSLQTMTITTNPGHIERRIRGAHPGGHRAVVHPRHRRGWRATACPERARGAAGWRAGSWRIRGPVGRHEGQARR